MDIGKQLESLERIWGVPDLVEGVRIEVSRRMTRSVGRCYPERGLIRLAERLLRSTQADGEPLREVITHEVAHIVVHRKHGRRAKPHGPEWRALMHQAGYPPRTALPLRHPGREMILT